LHRRTACESGEVPRQVRRDRVQFTKHWRVSRAGGLLLLTIAASSRTDRFSLRAKRRRAQQHFGKAGPYFYWIARGIDERPVRADRVRKSVGAENTFSIDLFTFEEARDAVLSLIEKVWRHCESAGTRGRTVTLKIKFADFQQITRSQSLAGPIDGRTALEGISLELLRAQFPMTKGIRLLGVSISAFERGDTADSEQLPLGI
jgi:DNA polymerase-4